MIHRIRNTLLVAIAILTAAAVSAHFAAKNTQAAFVQSSHDLEAFNELHRINSWGRIKDLIEQGCINEALEFAKTEHELGLLTLKRNLNNGAKLERRMQEENASIIEKAKNVISKGRYREPTCK